MTDHEKFVSESVRDVEFSAFVDKVSPRKNGVQQVFLAELFLVLQILWEIYQAMKKLGFFDRWFKTMQVRKIMKSPTVGLKQAKLEAFRDRLIVPVYRMKK